MIYLIILSVLTLLCLAMITTVIVKRRRRLCRIAALIDEEAKVLWDHITDKQTEKWIDEQQVGWDESWVLRRPVNSTCTMRDLLCDPKKRDPMISFGYLKFTKNSWDAILHNAMLFVILSKGRIMTFLEVTTKNAIIPNSRYILVSYSPDCPNRDQLIESLRDNEISPYIGRILSISQ